MTTSAPNTDSYSNSVFSHNLFDSDFEFNHHNMAEQRTLRELNAPNINFNILCIKYPEVDAPYKLKSGLVHLLPTFSNLAGGDLHKHMKEFQVVCSTPLRPQVITEDHVKLRAFPFSLQGAAKD